MGKTPASTRAGRKSKSKPPERKWCTCQERCNGGKEVAASTYRSHNRAMRPPAMRDGSEGSPVAVVGDKRKAGSDIDELSSEGGVREMRRTRARRIAQDEVIPRLSLTTATDREVMPRLSLTAAGGFIGTLDHVRPQESKTQGHREVQVQEYVEGDEGEEEPSWIPSVDVYPITLENGHENDEDYEGDDQIRATLRSVNETVSAILSWD